MAYLRFSELRASTLLTLQKSASSVLKEERSLAPRDAKFHVFLSHSSLDAADILRLKRMIEGEGLTVYVDWDSDGSLDRNRVTVSNCRTLTSSAEKFEQFDLCGLS